MVPGGEESARIQNQPPCPALPPSSGSASFLPSPARSQLLQRAVRATEEEHCSHWSSSQAVSAEQWQAECTPGTPGHPLRSGSAHPSGCSRASTAPQAPVLAVRQQCGSRALRATGVFWIFLFFNFFSGFLQFYFHFYSFFKQKTKKANQWFRHIKEQSPSLLCRGEQKVSLNLLTLCSCISQSSSSVQATAMQ